MVSFKLSALTFSILVVLSHSTRDPYANIQDLKKKVVGYVEKVHWTTTLSDSGQNITRHQRHYRAFRPRHTPRPKQTILPTNGFEPLRSGRCPGPGSPCPKGMKCVGPTGRMKCKHPMRANKRCGQDPYWVCADGLNCVKNVCTKKVPVNNDCSTEEGTCPKGKECVGPSGKKRCNKPMKKGGRCGVDPYWVCADGLTCVDEICRNNDPVEENCSPDTSPCRDGKQCVGPTGAQKCKKPMTEDEKCGQNPYGVCE